MAERLFTGRFFLIFAYSFTVFLSVFQLVPAAPYRVLDLGGSTAIAGLFQGVLTYSSAVSAPFTGAIADRVGHRPVLVAVSVILAVFAASYAFITSYHVMFVVAFAHGVVWSSLLSASGAYMTATVPATRRAEGIGYWGLASVLAVGAAPAIGFWVYRHGWPALCIEVAILNLVMATIAWYLPDDRLLGREGNSDLLDARAPEGFLARVDAHVEWRVLLLSFGLGLVTFGYGGVLSFSSLFVDSLGLLPRSQYLSAMAVGMITVRLIVGPRIDRLGHRRVLMWALVPPSIGLVLLALAHERNLMVLSALVFGGGFGLVYPAYTAFMLSHVAPHRRGAAFGAMLFAFDIGIASGASILGPIAAAHGFRAAFATAAALAALALPYFLFAERRLGFSDATPGNRR